MAVGVGGRQYFFKLSAKIGRKRVLVRTREQFESLQRSFLRSKSSHSIFSPRSTNRSSIQDPLKFEQKLESHCSRGGHHV
jgi:hypothetical protein